MNMSKKEILENNNEIQKGYKRMFEIEKELEEKINSGEVSKYSEVRSLISIIRSEHQEIGRRDGMKEYSDQVKSSIDHRAKEMVEESEESKRSRGLGRNSYFKFSNDKELINLKEIMQTTIEERSEGKTETNLFLKEMATAEMIKRMKDIDVELKRRSQINLKGIK